MKTSYILAAALSVAAASQVYAQKMPRNCVTDAELENVVLPQLQAGHFAISTSKFKGAPLCSGLPMSEKVQEIAARNSSPKSPPVRERYYNQGELPDNSARVEERNSKQPPRQVAKAQSQETRDLVGLKLPGEPDWLGDLKGIKAPAGTPVATAEEAKALYSKIANREFGRGGFINVLSMCWIMHDMLDTFPLAQRTSFFQETARMIIFAQIAKERALSSKDVDAINIDSGNRALKIWTVNSSNSSLRNLSAEEEMTKSIVLQCAPRNEQTSALRKRVFPFLNKKD